MKEKAIPRGDVQPIFREMKSATRFVLVLMTAPDLKSARALAKAALEARLIACANLVPKVESHYWWKDKIEQGAEVILLCKTSQARLRALEKLILAIHPYDTPEFLVVPLASGTEGYLRWLAESVASPANTVKARALG